MLIFSPLLKTLSQLRPNLPIAGRVLGIDFGLKQQGIAIGEADTYTVQPFTIIRENSRQKSINAILAIIDEWHIHTVIFGYPMPQKEQHNDTNSQVLNSLEKYIQALQQKCHLPLFLANEHFSSQQARSYNKELIKQRPPAQIDDLAAAIILQHWFNNLSSRPND